MRVKPWLTGSFHELSVGIAAKFIANMLTPNLDTRFLGKPKSCVSRSIFTGFCAAVCFASSDASAAIGSAEESSFDLISVRLWWSLALVSVKSFKICLESSFCCFSVSELFLADCFSTGVLASAVCACFLVLAVLFSSTCLIGFLACSGSLLGLLSSGLVCSFAGSCLSVCFLGFKGVTFVVGACLVSVVVVVVPDWRSSCCSLCIASLLASSLGSPELAAALTGLLFVSKKLIVLTPIKALANPAVLNLRSE